MCVCIRWMCPAVVLQMSSQSPAVILCVKLYRTVSLSHTDSFRRSTRLWYTSLHVSHVGWWSACVMSRDVCCVVLYRGRWQMFALFLWLWWSLICYRLKRWTVPSTPRELDSHRPSITPSQTSSHLLHSTQVKHTSENWKHFTLNLNLLVSVS